MRILILSQYFIPETGAPQNRLFQLATRLQAKGAGVEILAAMPNYPEMKIHEGYRGRFYIREEIHGITVHRAWIHTSSDRSIRPRLLNYFSFVFSSLLVGIFRTGRYDYVFCESPPLFLGISAFLLKTFKRSRLIFNVSDLWPESAEKLGLVSNRFLLKISRCLEEFLYRKSWLICGQTQGIVKSISARFPSKTVFWLKNGADVSELEAVETVPGFRGKLGFSDDDFLLLYAGILGHAQGLEVILHAALELRDHCKIKFLLMGSGPEKGKLVKLKSELGLENVFFMENRPKKDVIPVIRAADAAIIPLKKLELFKGAIPSKIFENLALKKTILLGVEGEAKELLIGQGKAGLAFIPEDPADLAARILFLFDHREMLQEFGNNGYDFLLREFNLDTITTQFWDLIASPDHSLYQKN
jgi:glycosyltransferase involved in cell wall biosynthesis